MNWEAIGAVGEVLGAIGVIVTLGYLAVRIRQNTRQLDQNNLSVRSSSSHAAQSTIGEFASAIAENEALTLPRLLLEIMCIAAF